MLFHRLLVYVPVIMLPGTEAEARRFPCLADYIPATAKLLSRRKGVFRYCCSSRSFGDAVCGSKPHVLRGYRLCHLLGCSGGGDLRPAMNCIVLSILRTAHNSCDVTVVTGELAWWWTGDCSGN
ncbi:hypothetical protein QBC35DRAFT_222910 [Podospora australis]|uniref:Secreted protein n=1 Tax=Podospora australis TaxID=1536484 RepID=A0AAN7AP26_9PEZI|nr:hypothetical protein QBC35DRAFT_222910 [Podospora australis]